MNKKDIKQKYKRVKNIRFIVTQSIEEQARDIFKKTFPLWVGGAFGVSSKAIRRGKGYRRFMRKYFLNDKDVGDMVKELPFGLWWLRLFRFEIIWFLFFWGTIYFNEHFFHIKSGIILAAAGKFGDGKFEAVYILFFIFHLIFYFFIKRYLWIKSEVFKNLMVEIDVIMENRIKVKKKK